jgi:predicted nucleotidyltransferase
VKPRAPYDRIALPLDEMERALTRVLETWASVRAAWLFGSVVEGGMGPLSDVDVAVLARDRLSFDDHAQLTVDLAAAVGRRCDVVPVEQASPVLGMEILRSGRRFFCRENEAADAWESAALTRYLGTAELRRLVQGYVRSDLLQTGR